MALNLSIPPSLRPYAVGLLALLVIATLVLIAVLIATGRDLTDPRYTTMIGFAITVCTILLTGLGLGGQVAAVHASINGRMTQLVDATASSAYQAGQSAGPGAPPLPPPSTIAPTGPPINP